MHDGCAREMGARNERKNLKCHLHVIFFLSLYHMDNEYFGWALPRYSR